ncbi:MAG: fibronectin type III domain-containing protein [Thermoleophilia bacterium]|nr:fibronectin type III domain-containing protein [Thermoleophilia bacterium]
MQASSNVLFKVAIVLLGLLIAVSVFVGASVQKAGALDTSQWETVRGYIEAYFSGQWDGDATGTGNLIFPKEDLRNAIDSNGDMSNTAPGERTFATATFTTIDGVLDEGDDAANRPVIIDNLSQNAHHIPGTSFRCRWSGGADGGNCFTESSVAAVKDLVDRHQEAGFSTDILAHCNTSHTSSPTTAGFGVLAQVPGALASDPSLTPQVYEIEWSRVGWINQVQDPFTNTRDIGAPDTSTGGFSAPATGWAPSACTSAATDEELVRCVAEWSIKSDAGNVGSGQTNLDTVDGAGQSVDTRAATPINTISTAGDNLQIPIGTLFTPAGLSNLDPSKSTVVVPVSQHGGQAAMGLKMLGYDMIPGGFIRHGISYWNNTEGEMQSAIGDSLPLQEAVGDGLASLVDTTPPNITTAPSASNITETSADISRVADEPATMKVEYGTASGVYTDVVNDTVLNADKTVGLTGLTPGTTYYVKVTSYDGWANGAESGAEFSLTTLDSQWERVRGYIEAYWSGPQFDPDRDGEAGIIYGKQDLHDALDSNKDMAGLDCTNQPISAGSGDICDGVTGVLGEGDDAANRPVLIDNLSQQSHIIPGTSFRCRWNNDEDCYSQSSLDTVKELVDAHEAAGFSTDIVVYCNTSHTAGPASGGFGILAQVPGVLASDSSLTPNVYELEYSRIGWTNGLPGAFDTSNPIGAPEASAGFSLPTTSPPPECESAATDAELVRCKANWAIASTLGNVGNGQSDIATIAGAQQSVDVRTGAVSTISTDGDNIQVPINELFTPAGLGNLDPLKSTVIVSRSQHAGMTNIGLKMLGYDLIPGGFINRGIPRWNSSEGEQQFAIGADLPLLSTAGLSAPAKMKTNAPNITTAPSASNVTTSSADISRVADEPATMKVEYGTASGVYTDVVNDTVLNADKTVSLTGLAEGTTYYVKVTSYDGWANGAESAEFSFTTPASCGIIGQPDLNLAADNVYWASYADYTARELSVDLKVGNTGADTAYNVALTGATATNGVSLISATPVSVGDIAGGTSATATVKYDVPGGVTSFKTSVSGSAEDCDGNGYTYP